VARRGTLAAFYNGPMQFAWRWTQTGSVAGLALCLWACSPALNWRTVSLAGTPLQAQLPCKPDRTEREVPLGGVAVTLQVAGCEADGAMFALMTARLPAGTDPQATLLGWQQATVQHLQASAPQWQDWRLPGALPMPAQRSLQASGRRADGQPVHARAVWAALAEGDGVRVLHAVVYAPRDPQAAAQAFFEALRP